MNSELDIRDEESLLLELCRLEFSDEHIKKIRSLIAVVADWDYFRNIAMLMGWLHWSIIISKNKIFYREYRRRL